MKQIGVLSLQGGFERHLRMVSRCGARALEVRYISELDALDGLILPGGESTTIGKLLERNGFIPRLQEKIASGFPIMSTCAGTILLANTIENSQQVRIGGLPIEIRRNAYGSQVDSFESPLSLQLSQTMSFPGVFIRAPQIIRVDSSVTILSSLEDSPVLVLYKSLLASTFHPELSDNDEIHRYFVNYLT